MQRDRYDPFASEDADHAVAGVTSRRVDQLQQNILASNLQPLPWQMSSHQPAESNGRPAKRPRPPVPHSAAAANSEAPGGPGLNGAPARSGGDGASKSNGGEGERVVERVVEKVVERVVEKVVAVPEEHITILGVPPLVDDRVRVLVNFILQHVTEPGIEIEAKLGVLIEKYKQVRATDLVPVVCETPLRPEQASDTRFESAVHHTFFSHLNAELNHRVDATGMGDDPKMRVIYLRTKEIDYFWPGKIRETRRCIRDPATGSETYERVRVQRKTRLGDLNFMCPFNLLDVRYSASKEDSDVSLPVNNVPDPRRQRAKERISYKFESLSVDITAVETTDPEAGLFGSPTHEIEVEVDESADLFGEVQKYRAGDPESQLFRIASALVNTVRLLMEEVGKAAANVEQQQQQEQEQLQMHQQGLQQGHEQQDTAYGTHQQGDAEQLQYSRAQRSNFTSSRGHQ